MCWPYLISFIHDGLPLGLYNLLTNMHTTNKKNKKKQTKTRGSAYNISPSSYFVCNWKLGYRVHDVKPSYRKIIKIKN